MCRTRSCSSTAHLLQVEDGLLNVGEVGRLQGSS